MMTIGPVEYSIEFQVLNIDASYKFLLGLPWVNKAREIPSALHQMIKFEHDKKEVVVHGEGDLSIYKDSSMPFIKENNEEETLI